MRRIILFLACMATGLTLFAQEKSILVAYFSCTGTTENVARAIASEVKGDLYNIRPASAYTSADLNWHDKQSRSSLEMADESSRPALADKDADIAKYDIIFLGYPIWWGLCPRPVNTFLESYDWKGKIVIPFATSGSSSIDKSEQALRQLYADVAWKTGRLCNDGGSAAVKWAKEASASAK